MISAIIPARNEEATIARVVESLASQEEVGELIVVNDQSTDRTGEILALLAAKIPKLKVIDAGELPAGWVGKNHAVALGAAASTGDWLLFTDADTFHLPNSSRRALEDALAHDAAVVSYSPEQETESLGERALIPYIFCRLDTKYPYANVNDPSRADAALNGTYVFVRRDAYEAVGGHASVAGEVLEDVAFARVLKKHGYRIYFAAPQGVVRIRMYRTFAAMWEGWTKNLYSVMGGTPRDALRELAPVMIAAVVTLGAAGALFFRHLTVPWFVACLLGLLVAGYFWYGVSLFRNRLPVSNVKYFIPGVFLYSAVLIASWWKTKRGLVSWKGRTYPVRNTAGTR